MSVKFKVKKGDKVIVISGRSKGQQGEVLKVFRESARVVVQGTNLVKKHTKPSAKSAGGVVEKEASIHISNVALIDPVESKPTKVGYQMIDGRKIRIARRSGQPIDR
ncbi:MAG TPA: 50S ribosomal protein L24 [Alphaproteobacteria bacterium]|jgi:large subunit ribosomal protein L24|nr:50S ribosomal protein L24 [Alphaproteobacteria bacterium]